MYRFSTNVKKIIHNDKLVLINLNTGQWIRMSMTVYKIIDKFKEIYALLMQLY